MNSKGNPVLIEMAGQLPEASKLYQLIMTSVNYATIFIQAKEDFFGFADLDKEIKNGNCMPLSDIPPGTNIHNIELTPNGGGKLARSAGSFAQISGTDNN